MVVINIILQIIFICRDGYKGWYDVGKYYMTFICFPASCGGQHNDIFVFHDLKQKDNNTFFFVGVLILMSNEEAS